MQLKLDDVETNNLTMTVFAATFANTFSMHELLECILYKYCVQDTVVTTILLFLLIYQLINCMKLLPSATHEHA